MIKVKKKRKKLATNQERPLPLRGIPLEGD